MRRHIVLLVFFYVLTVAWPVMAQENTVSLSSAVPDSARFEVVQSPLLAKLAFRLDRFNGDTWQFVSKQKGGFAWQRVERIALPGDTRVPGKVNYQIFLSGLRAQVTVLVNTNTGVSWYISEDPKEGVFWSPMD
ncbi:MAG TPA: hypothetical protein VN679_06725 [Candidatus Acidoferrales bacterium]|nr:hypothetical protein [Candidatus Acidoferrales bacterium]